MRTLSVTLQWLSIILVSAVKFLGCVRSTNAFNFTITLEIYDIDILVNNAYICCTLFNNKLYFPIGEEDTV